MTPASSVDENSFRKLLSRNVALPLGVGVLSAVFFVCLITYLLSVIQWVEHTDRVINNLNETAKLTVDQETGMRGFLITGDPLRSGQAPDHFRPAQSAGPGRR